MIIPKIQFSRHAKRRMKLYSIPEETVSDIIVQRLKKSGSVDGKWEVIDERSLNRYEYPIKVVFSQEKQDIIVITAYPLKRGLKK